MEVQRLYDAISWQTEGGFNLHFFVEACSDFQQPWSKQFSLQVEQYEEEEEDYLFLHSISIPYECYHNSA